MATCSVVIDALLVSVPELVEVVLADLDRDANDILANRARHGAPWFAVHRSWVRTTVRFE